MAKSWRGKKWMEGKGTPGSRQRDYLASAAWYFYRAVNSDDNLRSALYRMQASDAALTLRMHGEDLPSADEVYAMAKQLFPVDRLHESVPDN